MVGGPIAGVNQWRVKEYHGMNQWNRVTVDLIESPHILLLVHVGAVSNCGMFRCILTRHQDGSLAEDQYHILASLTSDGMSVCPLGIFYESGLCTVLCAEPP